MVNFYLFVKINKISINHDFDGDLLLRLNLENVVLFTYAYQTLMLFFNFNVVKCSLECSRMLAKEDK